MWVERRADPAGRFHALIVADGPTLDVDDSAIPIRALDGVARRAPRDGDMVVRSGQRDDGGSGQRSTCRRRKSTAIVIASTVSCSCVPSHTPIRLGPGSNAKTSSAPAIGKCSSRVMFVINT
jgi:hypothetical protein